MSDTDLNDRKAESAPVSSSEVSPSVPQSSALRQRLTFGIPMLAVVVGLLAWDSQRDGVMGLGILALIFGVGGACEFSRMYQLGRSLERAICAIVIVLLGTRLATLAGWEFFAGWSSPELSLLVLAPALFVLLPRGSAPGLEKIHKASIATLCVVYIGLPMVSLLLLTKATDWGINSLIYLVLVVKGNDSGAYLIGRRWGRTPLSAISPKKTWEGAIGGLLTGVAIGVAMVMLFEGAPFGILASVAVAVAIGVAGQLGDLMESMFKRSVGVKDSGALIPQFGGILDLLDSILLAGPLLLLIVTLWPAL